MKYPYLFLSEKIVHKPVFDNLVGDPFMLELSSNSSWLSELDPKDQVRFQNSLEKEMKNKFQWGLGLYLEYRESLLSGCPQMAVTKRYYHLGLDVIVPLGTPLRAPLNAVVHEAGYEAGEGNYGAYVLLRHDSDWFDTFYSLYGHLRRDTLPQEGSALAAGEPFAEIGDFHENGNWFHHTHVQIITQKAVDRGYILNGYCSESNLPIINELCPSPVPLFRRR